MQDPTTFDALYRAHAPSVFRRARRLLASDADAHDIVSEVFVSLYERPEQYQGRSTLSTFLYSMTNHACFNRIRSQKRRRRLLERVADTPGATAHGLGPERVTQLREMLQQLPEPLGHVAVYYYLDELTHEEIAEILGCSRRHVGNLIVRLHNWTRADGTGVADQIRVGERQT
jgi:RNA polymerase sigma factor (sigma-70 family)